MTSHLPQSGGHGEDAEDEVGDCEGGDEDVARGAHALVPQHRPDDEDVAQEASHQQHHVRHHQEPSREDDNGITRGRHHCTERGSQGFEDENLGSTPGLLGQ